MRRPLPIVEHRNKPAVVKVSLRHKSEGLPDPKTGEQACHMSCAFVHGDPGRRTYFDRFVAASEIHPRASPAAGSTFQLAQASFPKKYIALRAPGRRPSIQSSSIGKNCRRAVISPRWNSQSSSFPKFGNASRRFVETVRPRRSFCRSSVG